MGKIEFLEGKILENNNLLDLRLGFDIIEKIEGDLKSKLMEIGNISCIEDDNGFEEQMIKANNDFLSLDEGYENYELKIIKLELSELIKEYKNQLEKLFFLITDTFSKVKYRCDIDISRFFKLKIDNLIIDVEYINNDTVGKKMTPADLDMYYNNPYTLLHNTLVNHKDILQVYYNNLFSFDLDILEQSSIISNGLQLSFSEIDNLKKWEDSINYEEFTVSGITNPEIKKQIYTISNLLRKD